tara:strand:- start:1109 stop:3121 length:2013 start_codon:yes stop_codon:yes gene_type:complete
MDPKSIKSTKNPKNPDSNLYRRLTKLFSGPLINYRSQNTRQLRRRRLDKYAKTFKDVAGQKFERIGYNPFDNFSAFMMGTQSRLQRYADFDQMEYTPEIASALDIYADEMTTHTGIKKILDIDCHDEEIKGILDTLFFNVLNIEFNLFGWCRTMCKYGDFYLYLDIDADMGIKQVIGLPTDQVERVEGEDKTNPNYVQYQWNSGGVTFENWQMGHFRVLGNDKFAPYGTSVLDSARRIWRQLILLEDAMMAYRIVRAPERRVFKIDVGNIPPQDIEQYMQRVITSMKRNQVVDADTGRVDLRYNPMSVEEDYFIPVRGGVGTEIQSLPGGTYTGDIDDVKYLRDKLFSALKVPASYLSRAEGGDEDKATLAQKDIRFARTIQRLQRSVTTELEKIGIIHLYTLGYRGDDLLSFKIKLNNPSKISELQELEHWNTKFSVAAQATEGFFSKRWIARNLFDLSEEEFLRNQRELYYDKYFAQSIEMLGQDAMAAGGAAGGAMGALGGEEMAGGEDMGMGPEDLGGGEDMTAPMEEAPPTTEAGDEDTALLAAPGKRDDDHAWVKAKVKKNAFGAVEKTKSAKSKGWYEPVTTDKRQSGARKRNMKAKDAHEFATLPKRQLKMNLPDGADELLGLGKGIYESKETNYNDEERKLFEVSQTVRDLLNDLEHKDNA